VCVGVDDVRAQVLLEDQLVVEPFVARVGDVADAQNAFRRLQSLTREVGDSLKI